MIHAPPKRAEQQNDERGGSYHREPTRHSSRNAIGIVADTDHVNSDRSGRRSRSTPYLLMRSRRAEEDVASSSSCCSHLSCSEEMSNTLGSSEAKASSAKKR